MALESELTPTLHEIDERFRAANVLILGVDYDVLTKRVHFVIQPDPMWHKQVGGTAAMVEDILNGIPGEIIITDEQKKNWEFNPADDYQTFVEVLFRHSYLLVDGKYRQELGDCADTYLRHP